MKEKVNLILDDYLSVLGKISMPSDTRKIVVYTAIMGCYDQLLDPLIIDEGVSYICFTDSEKLRSATWTIVYVPSQYRDPRRTAKIFKMYPHLLFLESDISIWVDGSCKIVGSLTMFLDRYFDYSCNFACFAHYKRVSVREEREACKRQGKDDVTLIEEQEQVYLKEKFPDDRPLIAGGVLIRRHMKPDVIQFDELWNCEVDKYSVRDLLSFNYLAWRQNFEYLLLPLSLIDNGVFVWVPHRKLKFYDKNGNGMFRLRVLIDSFYGKLRFYLISLLSS